MLRPIVLDVYTSSIHQDTSMNLMYLDVVPQVALEIQVVAHLAQ